MSGNLLTYIDGTIRDNQLPLLILGLKKLPLDTLSADTARQLLEKFLLLSFQYRQEDPARLLFHYWQDGTRFQEHQFKSQHQVLQFLQELEDRPELTHNSQLDPLTRLFTRQNISNDFLGFLINVRTDMTSYEHLVNLANWDDAPQVNIAAKRVIDLYPDISYTAYQKLLEIARDEDNRHLVGFLELQVEKTAPFAPSPSWMIYPPGHEEIPQENEIEIPAGQVTYLIPKSSEIVENAMEGLRQAGITIEERENAQSTIEQLLNTSSPEEVRLLIRPMMETLLRNQLQDDHELFQILGPANPRVGADLSVKDVCCHWGGCRMLLCTEYEIPDDDEIYESRDWFTGVCQECHLKIANRTDAVRQPIPDGGWRGCYCSWKCVRQGLPTGRPDIASGKVTTYMEIQVEEIGILARRTVPGEPTLIEEAEDVLNHVE